MKKYTALMIRAMTSVMMPAWKPPVAKAAMAEMYASTTDDMMVTYTNVCTRFKVVDVLERITGVLPMEVALCVGPGVCCVASVD